jgi:hypothetical protein
LFLTLFCQDDEERRRYLEISQEGKAKNTLILIMLIGQGRGGKTSLMRRLLGLPLNPSAMPMPVAL